MTGPEFKAEIAAKMAVMFDHWREIERWIKRAEQVNKRAVIPAINELRYAARQLLYADKLLKKRRLSAGDMSVVRKRVDIAEQYLMNADNDVVDSIVSFYSEAFYDVDQTVGQSKVTEYFPDYPRLRTLVREAEKQIGDTRHDPEDRLATYKKLRKTTLEPLIVGYDAFLDAETNARLGLAALERQSGNRARINRFFGVITVVSLLVAVLSFDSNKAEQNVESVLSFFGVAE